MKRLLLKLFRRRNLEAELEAELAFHREMSAAQNNPIPLGNATLIAEDALDPWRFSFLENLWRDFRYGIRGLRRNPTLVVTAVVSLALGIGVNTSMFSLGMEFLLSEPSVADAGSVVALRLGYNSHSDAKIVDALHESNVFQAVTGENGETFINWNDGNITRRIFSVLTARNYFTVLAPPMAHGRGYAPGDPKDVVVLCHRFWQTHFNSDPSVVGRSIQLDGRFYTVMGVLPAGHRTLLGFGFSPDVYLPYYNDETTLAIYARLKPGMTLGEARAGVAVAAERLSQSFPDRLKKQAAGIRVSPLAGMARLREESQLLTIGLFFIVLLLVVGLVLLIACVNVASLLLARASTRRREIAIRLSLGAGRYRLLQQLLVESLLLSVLGAACGFALSQLTMTLLSRIQLPLPLPIRLQAEPDWRVVSYAALLTLLATIACGLLPAWQSLKESLTSDLHVETRFRLRRALVAVQIAISVIVLTTGVLFLRNLALSTSISPGFDVRRTLRAEVHMPAAYQNSQRMLQYAEEGVRTLSALPGIESVAAARIIPFTDAALQGSPIRFADGGQSINARFRWNAVTPAFFQTMEIPFLSGRSFLESERAGQKVVVVNRTFVHRYSPDRDAVGRTFLWEAARMPCLIVGVVEDTKNLTIGEDPEPQLYQPLAQISNDRTRIQFVLRSLTPPATQIDATQQALRRIEPGAGIEVATLFSSIGLAFLPSQVGAALLGSMGILGLLLAAVGLYGVMVYAVSRRTREIGLRMAIGANRNDILRLVLLDSFGLLAIGSAVGLFAAFFVTKPLAMFLVPGLAPSDVASFAAVVLVLLFTGMLATWGPARRAAAIDPMVSLRCD